MALMLFMRRIKTSVCVCTVALRLRKNTLHTYTGNSSCTRRPIFDLLIVVLLSELHVKAQNEWGQTKNNSFLLVEIIKIRKGKFKEKNKYNFSFF